MKQKLILILTLCLTFNLVNGQDFSKLKAKAENTTNGKAQLQAYITLIDTLIWNEQQLDECKSYIKKARQLASKYGSKNDQLHINLLGMRRDFYAIEGDVVQWIEENESTYLQLKSPLLKAKYFLFAGIVRENKGLVGLPDFTRARKIYEAEETKGNHDKYAIDTYLRITYYYRYSNWYDSSMYFLHQGMQVNKILQEPTSSIWLALEQLEHYKLEAKYSEGIQLCLQWLNGKKGNLSFENEIAFREQLMIFYLDNLELDKAINIGERLIGTIRKQGITNRTQRKIIAYTYIRIATANIKKSNYQEALAFLEEAQLYKDDLSKTLMNDKVFYLKLEALMGLKEYELAEQLAGERMKGFSYNGYGGYFSFHSMTSICYQLYSETDFAPSPQEEKFLIGNIQYLLDNSQEKNHEIALIAYRLKTLLAIIKTGNKQLKEDFLNTIEIKDNLFNTRNEQTTKNLLIQYQTKEKEQEIQLQKLALARKNTQRNLLIGLFFIMVLIGFALVWYFRNRNQILQRDLKNKERIAQQAEELERLYEQQNRMFNNIAHELRTPLTLILAPIRSIIQKTQHIAAIQSDLLTAKRNVNHLQQMVNQILDLSKAQTKQFSIHITQFKLEDLFTTLKNDFASLAQYKEIDFQFILPTNRAIELNTDGDKLFTVLKNLLSNAFKYTPPQGKVSVMAIDLGEQLQITVEDNGKGISKADLPRIFDYYYQTQDKNKLLEGGTGIGLAICKEYVEALKGTILVNSDSDSYRDGKGASFIVTIPKTIQNDNMSLNGQPAFLQYKNTPTTPSKPAKTVLNSSKPSHLLIVEDNLEIANYLASILKNDYELTFKNNGKEALNALETVQPDLIITDLMMPIMNGYELVEALKNNKQWQKIPIITLTALGEMAHKIKALRIGVDDYLVKPFDNEELCLRIKNLLKNKRKREEFVEEMSICLDDAPLSITELNPSRTHSLLDAEWLETLETTVKNEISHTNFNVSQLCLKLTISSSQLYRKTKSLTGLSPKEYINQIRYTTARQLLEAGTFYSVKRVAYEVGFKDEKYFARNFKKRFGRYPSEYLAENLTH